MKSLFPALRWGPIASLLPLAALSLAIPASAAEVVVRVSGIAAPYGDIGCSLYANPTGFPMDSTAARSQWLKAVQEGVACKFEGVGRGTYAVAVGHDRNGNRKVDTNFLGLPTEQWGVSGNLRPLLRAPHFDEASFQVSEEGATVQIDVTVAK